jgi:hypothetical protein
MHGIASGSIPTGKGGPSKSVAQDFVDADKPGLLPEHVKEGKPVKKDRYATKVIRRGR